MRAVAGRAGWPRLIGLPRARHRRLPAAASPGFVHRRIGPVAASLLIVAGCVSACGPSSDGEPAPVEPGVSSAVQQVPEPAEREQGSGAQEEPTAGLSESDASAPDAIQVAGIPPADEVSSTASTGAAAPPQDGAPGPIARDAVLRVGVLLPLSGAYAATGRELFQAVEMALFEVDAERIELLPRDTASDAETARTAFLELAAEGASLVIGPLFAWTTGAVVPEAVDRGIPVLALSNDISVADREAWMLGVHPRGEVHRILGHAIEEPGQRVGLIVPESDYGDAVAEAYQLAVPPRNRSGLIRYNDDSEPSEVAQQFVDTVRGSANRPGDAVLIAARGNALRAIAAELAYRDVAPDEVRYLGLSSWRTSDLQGEPALEGGRFADLSEEAFRRFAERFRRIYGTSPSRTAALAYDASAVAANLAGVDPDARIARLQTPQGFRGLLGAFRLLTDGAVERGLNVYEVRRDGYSLLERAPARFAPTPQG